MDVGVVCTFMGRDKTRTDEEVYANELRLADLVEPLGFDAIWGIEHHFTNYTMCPDVMQFLTYMAGRTKRVRLATSVIVLPWHRPVRVVEQLCMLDHLSKGRAVFGMGRGLGRIEFEGLGIDQNNARGIFHESAKLILEGLETGVVEYDGQFIKQVRREIRPKPIKTFKGRIYAAANTKESAEIIASLGIGLILVPQKPPEKMADEVVTYRKIFQNATGREAPPVVFHTHVYCDKDLGRAKAYADQYIGDAMFASMEHYEIMGTHFGGIKGYEAYTEGQKELSKPGALEKLREVFVHHQIWGPPAKCLEMIREQTDMLGAGAINAVFSYAGLPYDAAESSMRLFAAEVLPTAKAFVPKKLT